MVINLTRKEPKLNTMYPITIHDSEQSIACRISFNIIDFIYLSIVRKNNANKTDYYPQLYDFLSVGEKYYEALRNGKKVDKIRRDRSYRFVEVNKIISGSIRLEMTGVSVKQWEQYFSICKKYNALCKAGVDKKYINKAGKRKKQFQNLIFRKIDNMEMSEEACHLYRKLAEYLFEDKLSKVYRAKGKEWIKFMEEISGSELEGLWKTDKNMFNELCRSSYDLCMKLKQIKNKIR